MTYFFPMVNGTILQCFHAYLPINLSTDELAGGTADGLAGAPLWQQLTSEAATLAEVGFSALWLPPMTKASGGATDVGYSAYDLYDLGEFDQCGSVATKYGDRAQLLNAIAAAHSAGLQVYGDVVLHRKHGGDGIELLAGTLVSWRDRNRAIAPAQSIKVHSQFTFPGRGQRYSDMTWRGEHFQLANHNALAATPLKKRSLYRLKPKPFSTEIDVRLVAQTSTLACELDLEMPAVAQALNEWGQWLLETTGVNGLRLDGANHMSTRFVREWVQQLRSGQSAQAAASPLFVMGDCWSDQVNDLHWYIAKTDGQLSLFDVPLHYNFHRASRQEGYYDLRDIFKGTLTEEQPALAVTFVENHNSQLQQLLESPVEDWFKPLAYVLILLRQEGYPCVFAADYYGASYTEGLPNGDIREVCLPSHQVILERLMFARSHHAYGPQHDYFEQQNIIGWTRLGTQQRPQAMAVVISNGQGGVQWMQAGKPNARFIDITGHLREPVWTNDDGWAAFSCPRRSVSVWVECVGGMCGWKLLNRDTS